MIRSPEQRRKRRRSDSDEDTYDRRMKKKKARAPIFLSYELDEVQKELVAVKCYVRLLLNIHKDIPELDQECAELLDWMKLCTGYVEDRRRFQPLLLAITKMFGVVRECLLSHAWDDAFRVFMTIVLHPLRMHRLEFLRVALEVYHRTLYGSGQPSAFIGHLNQFPILLRKQVCVDHFLYRLVTLPSEFQWVEILRDLDNSLIVEGKDFKIKKTKRDEITESVLYSGYRAMFLYLKFMRSKQEYSTAAIAAMAGTEQLTHLLNQQLELALKAFQEFELNSRKEVGCWDIFISKYTELLNIKNTDESREKAEKTLKLYVKWNSLNPNAWRLLYRFYTHHGYAIEHRLSALQELCDCVPSDPLAVELYKLSLLGKASYGRECDPIALFFNHLDYNMGDTTAWGIMAEILVTRSSQREDRANYEKFIESVKECWVTQNRNSWWPLYQFAPPTLPLTDLEDDEREKLLFKAVVAWFLLGLKNQFTVTVKDSLYKTKVNSEARMLFKAAKHLPTFTSL